MGLRLLIEFGALQSDASQHGLGAFDDAARQTSWLAEQLSIEHRVTILPVPYEGLPREGAPFRNIQSQLCGGRGGSLTPQAVDALVEANSKHDLSTLIAANGGLLANRDKIGLGSPDGTIEGYVADSLHRNTRGGVRNLVAITLPEVQREVRSRYPGLSTIASCIRFTTGFADEDYDAAFDLSHAVVPMPQDFRRGDFLDRHRKNAGKIMPLLNLPCANADRIKCYFHYLRLEALAKGVPQAVLDDPRLLQERLSNGAHSAVCKSQHCCLVEASKFSKTVNAGRAMCQGCRAIDDPNLLRKAIRAGVWQFKIARSSHDWGHPLKSRTARTLIRLFAEEHRRATGQVP